MEISVRSVRRTLVDHVPLYACAVLFCIVTVAVSDAYGVPIPLEAGTYFLSLVFKFLIIGVAAAALVKLALLYRHERPAHPLPAVGRWLSSELIAADRFGNVFHAIVAFTPLMIAFAAFKDDVPKLNPFSWDPLLMSWSRRMGMGELPWRILQPYLGHPPVTAALSLVYESWFVIMFGCFFWQAFSAQRSVVRSQYLLAFAFSWFIAGGILAAIFSSAGPCYYGYLFPGHNPYAQQMQYLHAVAKHWPVWSVQLQDVLWQSYVTGHGEISGISAMPSMHMETSALMAILGWHVNRRIGIAFTAFAVLIEIGSVHLAWHYLADGIAGTLIALIFWYAAGVVVRLTGRTNAARAAIVRTA